MANHKKQFCPKGHDTFIVGRLSGGCLVCRREASKQRLKENPTAVHAAIKKWAIANKNRTRDSELRRLYKITLVDYWRMHKEQDGCCVICMKQTDLVVDHDHCTGKVRGLLCSSCNRGIGYLKDNVGNLERATAYLSKLSPVQILN